MKIRMKIAERKENVKRGDFLFLPAVCTPLPERAPWDGNYYLAHYGGLWKLFFRPDRRKKLEVVAMVYDYVASLPECRSSNVAPPPQDLVKGGFTTTHHHNGLLRWMRFPASDYRVE